MKKEKSPYNVNVLEVQNANTRIKDVFPIDVFKCINRLCAFFCFYVCVCVCVFNWDSLHARLNKKKKHKKGYSIQEICLERTFS